MGDFVQRHSIQGPIICFDSDILIFENVFDDLAKQGIDLATTRELGPAFTFFGHPKILQGLLSFFYEAYQNPQVLNRLQEIFRTGISPFFLQGKYVSDMHLLGLYYRNLDRKVDLFEYSPKMVFDYAFHSAEGFSWNPYKRIKRIRWKDGKPHGLRQGVLVQFAGLHFQVGTKIYIPRYYRGAFHFSDRIKFRFIYFRGAITTMIKFILARFRRKQHEYN